MNTAALVLLLAAAPVALVNWVGVARDDRRSILVAKPLTLALLIAAAVAMEPEDGTVRLWFVIGLVLSLAGDVFLMLPEDGDDEQAKVTPFLLGLVAFLFGHIAYVIGMATDIRSWPLAGVGVVVVGAIGVGVAPRIVAGVKRSSAEFVVPVLAYMAVISTMVLASFGRAVVVGIVGALLFYVSDAILAWNRFVKPSLVLRVGVMVTYHLGQLGLVLSLLW